MNFDGIERALSVGEIDKMALLLPEAPVDFDTVGTDDDD